MTTEDNFELVNSLLGPGFWAFSQRAADNYIAIFVFKVDPITYKISAAYRAREMTEEL